FYTEDHYPAPGWRSTMGDAPADYNMVTLNPLKWMRIPCVAPIPAAQIFVSHESFGFPQWVKHTEQFVQTINVTNDGNVTLDVSSMVATEDTPAVDWLQISEASLSIPAGVDNVRTFDLTIDGTAIGAPGTVVALNGDVTLTSNASNNPTLEIPIIDFLVADTLIGIEYDTIGTGTVNLAVLSIGEAGFGGAGNVNLDYVTDGGECNPSTANPNTGVYLFSGGPTVVLNLGGDEYGVGQAMHQNNFTTQTDWRRVSEGADDAHLTGANYDGYFTGTVVTPDSLVAFERTYYAPTDGGGTAAYMIMKTDYYSYKDTTLTGVAIGEMHDWDVPSEGDAGSNNTGLVGAYSAVYLQGVDTATVPPCQLNADRYAAVGFLGMHTAADTADDECANDCEPHGSYSIRNDSLFAAQDGNDPNAIGPWFWEKMGTLTGAVAEPDDETDLHSVMTAVHDYSLTPGEVLTVYTVVTTVMEGTVDDLEANLDAAFEWYGTNLRPGCTSLCGCCVNLTGNVDNDVDDICDIGDLTKLIDFLFISYTPPVCMEEANCDGSTDGVVDMGDLTKLIDFLFISYNPTAPC
ncbi:MAG: hypothetical protein JSU65_01360, partial [Candidatus Zixiibacteriota bacterium]